MSTSEHRYIVTSPDLGDIKDASLNELGKLRIEWDLAIYLVVYIRQNSRPQIELDLESQKHPFWQTNNSPQISFA